jgi:hypothetical protein
VDLQLDRKKHTVVVTANKDIMIATDDIGDIFAKPQFREVLFGEKPKVIPQESYREPDGEVSLLRAAVERGEREKGVLREQLNALRSLVDELKIERQRRVEESWVRNLKRLRSHRVFLSRSVVRSRFLRRLCLCSRCRSSSRLFLSSSRCLSVR